MLKVYLAATVAAIGGCTAAAAAAAAPDTIVDAVQDFVEFSIDGELTRIEFDARTKRVEPRVEEMCAHWNVTESCRPLADSVVARRDELRDLRAGAVVVDQNGLRRVLARTRTALRCADEQNPGPRRIARHDARLRQTNDDGRYNELVLNRFDRIALARPERTGRQHQSAVVKLAALPLQQWEKGHGTTQDAALIEAMCTLAAGATDELDRLSTTTLLSSAFSYRWIANIGLGMSVLSGVRDPTEPNDPLMAAGIRALMHIGADLIDATIAIEPSVIAVDTLFAGGLLHRILGQHDIAAAHYRAAALALYGVERERRLPRSPATEAEELFTYVAVGESGVMPEDLIKFGVPFGLRHEAAQIRYLVKVAPSGSPFGGGGGASRHDASWTHTAGRLDAMASELTKIRRMHLEAASTAFAAAGIKIRQQHKRWGATLYLPKGVKTKGNMLELPPWPVDASIIHRSVRSVTVPEAHDVHGRILHMRPTPALPADTPVLGSWDGPALEDRYLHGHASMHLAWQDDFLSEKALDEIRKFALESTVFHHTKGEPDAQGLEGASGYLGSYLETGFASGLLLQIAERLRQRIPKVLAHLRLTQAWSYKYCQGENVTFPRGINVHADEAEVNVNFWITADAANEGQGSGGLIVYDKAAPTSMSFDDMNRDKKRIYEFLHAEGEFVGGTKSKYVEVPYKANRIVMFESTLFHETGRLKFKKGFENSRINLTFLFGGRPAAQTEYGCELCDR